MKDIAFQLAFILLFVFVSLVIIVMISGCNGEGKFLGIFDTKPKAISDDDLIDSGKKQLFSAVKGSNWLVTFSILGMAAGVFALMNGSRIGIPAIVASGASLFMALAVARFATFMAVCGFIGAFIAVVISILVKHRALKEVVGNVQSIKDTAKLDNVDLVFQDKIKETLAKQANSTRKLISKIKAKL